MQIARLTKWDGSMIESEIKREWANAIMDAVKGQFYYVDKVSGFGINGSNFKSVIILEKK